MKTLMKLTLLVGLVTLLAGCGGTAGPAPASAPAPAADAAPAAATTPAASTAALTEAYDDALSIRNQLAYGLLRLEGSADAVTAEQAGQLLPLWQALQTLDDSTTAAAEETAAVQAQIQATLTPAQVATIAGMRLTNAMLQAYYTEIGVASANTPEPGVTPQSGRMKDLSPEEREAAKATAQAQGTPVGAGGGTKKDALADNVIALLTARVSGK